MCARAYTKAIATPLRDDYCIESLHKSITGLQISAGHGLAPLHNFLDISARKL
jgi:hypothetical protein